MRNATQSSSSKSERMPVLFIGHGSPMNAIETNEFTQTLVSLSEKVPRPRAILCVSAHWMTEGTWVTAMDRPKTIHDFYGFPKALFDIQYPAPGAPEIATLIRETVQRPSIVSDKETWGLDHGSWSVLRHMYPKADIPVLEMSVYMEQTAEYHLQLGEKLRPLRDQGILIVGSGNIVHNLQQLSWESSAAPYPWAIEFDQWSKQRLESRDFKSLATQYLKTEAGKLSVPSNDHYFPLFPVLGASDNKDEMQFEYGGIQNSSISMRAVSFGIKRDK